MSEFREKIESMIINESDKAKCFEYSIQMTRWLFQIVGAWPFNTSFYPKSLQIIMIVLSIFLMASHTIPFGLFMFLIVKDFKLQLRLAGPFSFGIMNILKYWSVMSKNKEIQESVNWISKDWQTSSSTEERTFMLEKSRTARYFTTVCIIFMYTSGMSYCVTFPFTQEKIEINNVTMRPLVYPSYFIFFDPYMTKTVRDMIYLMHCSAAFITFTITLAVCSIAIICTLHICGQIAVTSWMLQNLSSSFSEQAFANIVRKHLRSLKFAWKLEKMLNFACAVEMVNCTFNMCMLGYYFITEYDPNAKAGPYIYYIILIVSFTFNIFVFCYIGDLLTEQCDTIGKVAYSVDWYQMPGKQARNLVIIVALTQHPVTLTAGKMATLSLQNFTNVLKASVSYLNVLRTVTN